MAPWRQGLALEAPRPDNIKTLKVSITFRVFMLKYTRSYSMAKKIDGIIEAVRYKNGQIVMVRAYERRGSTYSDRILIDRRELLERLKGGKQFFTGSRKKLLASTFDSGKALQVVSRSGREWITTRDSADRDELEQVPMF